VLDTSLCNSRNAKAIKNEADSIQPVRKICSNFNLTRREQFESAVEIFNDFPLALQGYHLNETGIDSFHSH
jgi:hypothetical protein